MGAARPHSPSHTTRALGAAPVGETSAIPQASVAEQPPYALAMIGSLGLACRTLGLHDRGCLFFVVRYAILSADDSPDLTWI